MRYLRLVSYFVCLATISTLAKGSSAPSNLHDGFGQQTAQAAGQNGKLAGAGSDSNTAIDIYRLNDEITPLSYELRVAPDLQRFTFFGRVEITIRAKFTTNQISLHRKRLAIRSVRVLRTDRARTPVDNTHAFDETNDLMVITTARAQPLIFGTEYTLVIEFEGTLGENLVGFYRSSYVLENRENWMAITQFEPNHAREAFPCFDEPRFRTPFTIYIARTATQFALSNMPSESVLPSDSVIGSDRVWEKFRPSPAMPTYLVSYMLSDFTYTTNTETSVRVYARRNAVEAQRVLYPLRQAGKILQQLEGYFGIANKISKMDIVAIPDFKLGGMENWGMVTFKERFVLIDESASSAQHRHIITQLISHEFAHQWFGNLVTPAWYNNLWMKEGFATYFEAFTSAAVEPDWNLDELFVIEYVQKALWNEVTTQRAMKTPIRKTNQLSNIFDIISYEKAGAVIRMLEHMVTPSTFRNALNRFLSDGDSRYGGVVVDKHLFDAFHTEIERFSNRLPARFTIYDIMRTWTENIGYPLIKVTRCYDDGKLKINQASYRALAAPTPLPDQTWIVPLTYTTSSLLQFSDTRPSSWSFSEEPTVLQEKFSNTDWVLFNLQQVGYYRVNYDVKNWNLLIEQLQKDHKKIPVLNRAQLISDVYALAYDEYLSYQVALKLTEYLSKETDMIPWYAAINAFNVLRYKLQSTTGDVFFKKYLYDLVKKSYDTIGYGITSTDSHLVKIVKPLFLMLACNLDIDDCILKSQNEYRNNEADLTRIQPDVKRVVYCQALRNSEDQLTVFNNLWTTYTRYDISYEKQQILTALTCASNEEVIKRVLSKMIDPTNKEIRKQDRSYFLDWVTSRPAPVTASLKFVGEKIATISELNEDGIQFLKNLLYSLEHSLQTQDQLQQLKDLETKFAALDQNRYAEFTTISKNLQLAHANRVKFDVQKLDRLHKEYLQTCDTKPNTKPETKKDTDKDKEKPTTSNPPQPPTSGAANSIPKLGWRLFAASILLCYSLSRFGVL